MTVVANITIYLVTWIFLGIENDVNMIGPDDAPEFRNVMLVAIALGSFASLSFHFFIRKSDFTDGGSRVCLKKEANKGTMKAKDWFCEPQFYLIALIYAALCQFGSSLYADLPSINAQSQRQIRGNYPIDDVRFRPFDLCGHDLGQSLPREKGHFYPRLHFGNDRLRLDQM